MDIALVHPELIYPRGAEKQLSKLAFHLSKKGHTVTVYTFEKADPYIFDPLLERCTVVALGKRWKSRNFLLNYPRWHSMCKELASKLDHDHDLINCHNFPASWVSGFSSKPAVWMCNEPPGLYSYMKKGFSLKKALYPAFSIFDRRMCRRIRTIAALDERMKKIISLGYPDKEITVVGSGAELDRRVVHIDNGATDLLSVAALDPHKRPLDIIEAIAASGKKIRAHFVGTGPLEEAVRRRASELGVELTMYGNVGDEKLYELYSLADLSVFVPEAQPWGIFPLESILSGIPTIISDETGVRDILGDKIPVVKTGAVGDLASRMKDMIENPDRYRPGLKESMKMLAERYTWEAYSVRMSGLFRKLVSE
ncbi:MAG: glycosyltransferase family 4 protein [Candidatus Micrarchaeia archaeon]